jgi:hypothetical protein
MGRSGLPLLIAEGSAARPKMLSFGREQPNYVWREGEAGKGPDYNFSHRQPSGDAPHSLK